jgi:hypothetical protein
VLAAQWGGRRPGRVDTVVRAQPGRGSAMELLLGPSNPALHTRPSGTLRGRAAGSSTVGPLQPDTPPNHDDQLITGLRQQFGHRPRRRRRPRLPGRRADLHRPDHHPDELVPTASAARYELEALVHELGPAGARHRPQPCEQPRRGQGPPPRLPRAGPPATQRRPRQADLSRSLKKEFLHFEYPTAPVLAAEPGMARSWKTW